MDEMTTTVDDQLGELRYLPMMLLVSTLLTASAMLMTWLSSRGWVPALIIMLITRQLLKQVAQAGQDLEGILADLDIGVTVSIGTRFQSLCWTAYRFTGGHVLMLLLQPS